MTHATSSCPSHETLANLAAGNLPPDLGAATRDHLATCTACRDALADLQHQESLLVQLRTALGLDAEAALRATLQPAIAGKYELLEALGSGATGIVFKARDLQLSRLVAIKCLASPNTTFAQPPVRGSAMIDGMPADDSTLTSPPASSTSSRLLHEARQFARINHPNVAAIYAVSDAPPLPFIVMEFIHGIPITEALADRPLSAKLEAFQQLLRAVAELHRRNLVHQDLKPANVLLDPRGTVKLVDFGIAHSDLTLPSNLSPQGTPAYMPPEQSLGKSPAPTADVFSLGIILFELLTGQRPFSATTLPQLQAAIRESNPPLPRALNPEIPGALQAICLTALEKDPQNRYPSAHHFLLDLQRFLNGEAVTANPPLLASILDYGIERHLSDLRRWQSDRMISTRECDYFLDKYDALRQREEFWVLDSRRISFSQVMLHLGAWSCVVAALLMLIFAWPDIGIWRPLFATAIFLLLLVPGTILWRLRTHRIAIVLLMGATTAVPLAVGTFLRYHDLFNDSPGQDLFPRHISNGQLFVSTGFSLMTAIVLWRYTRTTAFALLFAITGFAFTTSICALADMKSESAETVAGWYLWFGFPLLGFALYLDLARKLRPFAAPLYLSSMLILLASLTTIAYSGPTSNWLGITNAANDTPDYWRLMRYAFIFNGIFYLTAAFCADLSRQSSSLRRIATLLFWLAPSHILIPFRFMHIDEFVLFDNWTLPQILLPVLALIFIFASVPKQMKSFFFSGLAYLALSIHQLTDLHFENYFSWPFSIAAFGIILTLAAWRYPTLFDRPTADRKLEQ